MVAVSTAGWTATIGHWQEAGRARRRKKPASPISGTAASPATARRHRKDHFFMAISHDQVSAAGTENPPTSLQPVPSLNIGERLHQGRGNVPLSVADADEPPVLPFPKGEVVCRSRLGRLLRQYYRATA